MKNLENLSPNSIDLKLLFKYFKQISQREINILCQNEVFNSYWKYKRLDFINGEPNRLSEEYKFEQLSKGFFLHFNEELQIHLIDLACKHYKKHRTTFSEIVDGKNAESVIVALQSGIVCIGLPELSEINCDNILNQFAKSVECKFVCHKHFGKHIGVSYEGYLLKNYPNKYTTISCTYYGATPFALKLNMIRNLIEHKYFSVDKKLFVTNLFSEKTQ